ncbi:MAG: tetratricopeptide repeat protein [Verrucomicrobiota bacterium]
MRTLCLLSFVIPVLLSGQEPFPKPDLSKAPPVISVEPDLPEGGAGFPVDVNNYENPLLLFQGAKQEIPMADDPSPDLLPPISPYLPGDKVPAGTPDKPLTPDELRLRSLGIKIVSSVVGLRVWDSFGTQLAHGVGCYVSKDGVILTDAGLLHPEIAEKIDYITVTGADGTNHKIAGFYVADLSSGIALLQGETTGTIPLELAPDTNFREEQACHVLAMSEKRGLVLADATAQMDSALTGLGWLNVRGKDSPGGVGSPLINDAGQMIGIVAMQVPLKNWMNFALPCDAAAFEIRKGRAPLKPLSSLPKTPKLREVANDPEFVRAFETLQKGRVESAMRQFVALARKYPRSAECWALLGLTASYLGAAPEALNCQRKAVALDPKAGLYWHQLAFAKLREKAGMAPDSTEDKEALELATEQRPNDALAWLLLASRRVRDGDLGSADDALRRVMLLAPNYAQAYYLSAYVKGRQKDYEGAQTAISQSLKLNPGYSEAWYYQGLLLDKHGDADEAAKAYRNTVRLRPTHPNAWKNLAYALKKSGKSTEAREAFEEHAKRGARK